MQSSTGWRITHTDLIVGLSPTYESCGCEPYENFLMQEHPRYIFRVNKILQNFSERGKEHLSVEQYKIHML